MLNQKDQVVLDENEVKTDEQMILKQDLVLYALFLMEEWWKSDSKARSSTSCTILDGILMNINESDDDSQGRKRAS